LIADHVRPWATASSWMRTWKGWSLSLV
jgi:hypothetical protein